MRYVAWLIVGLCLHGCSPNPMYGKPTCDRFAPAYSWAECTPSQTAVETIAQTPAQHELHTLTVPSAPTYWHAGDGAWVTPSAQYIAPTRPADWAITVNGGPHQLAAIRADGRVFLNGREVHTDPEYRAVMRAILAGAMGCTNEKQLNDAARVEGMK